MALLTLTLNIRNMKYHCFSSFFFVVVVIRKGMYEFLFSSINCRKNEKREKPRDFCHFLSLFLSSFAIVRCSSQKKNKSISSASVLSRISYISRRIPNKCYLSFKQKKERTPPCLFLSCLFSDYFSSI